MIEDTNHMHRDRHYHQVGSPTVHITNKQAERYGIPELINVLIGRIYIGNVIEHQKDTGDCEKQKQEKRNTSHTPGVRNLHSLTANFHRVKMEKDVAHHHQ